MDLKKKNSSVAPLSFYFFFSFFCGLSGSFFYVSHLSSLGSFHLCPLLGSFNLSSLDLFLTVKATLYIKINMINTLLQGTHNETETIS